jgi:hypothetical protein
MPFLMRQQFPHILHLNFIAYSTDHAELHVVIASVLAKSTLEETFSRDEEIEIAVRRDGWRQTPFIDKRSPQREVAAELQLAHLLIDLVDDFMANFPASLYLDHHQHALRLDHKINYLPKRYAIFFNNKLSHILVKNATENFSSISIFPD